MNSRPSLTRSTETSSTIEEVQPGKVFMDKDDLDSQQGESWQLVISASEQHSSEAVAVQLESRYKTLASDEKEPTPVGQETTPCSHMVQRLGGLKPLPPKESDWCWRLKTPCWRGQRLPSASLTC